MARSGFGSKFHDLEFIIVHLRSSSVVSMRYTFLSRRALVQCPRCRDHVGDSLMRIVSNFK